MYSVWLSRPLGGQDRVRIQSCLCSLPELPTPTRTYLARLADIPDLLSRIGEIRIRILPIDIAAEQEAFLRLIAGRRRAPDEKVARVLVVAEVSARAETLDAVVCCYGVGVVGVVEGAALEVVLVTHGGGVGLAA